jgi:hypothetical protein
MISIAAAASCERYQLTNSLEAVKAMSFSQASASERGLYTGYAETSLPSNPQISQMSADKIKSLMLFSSAPICVICGSNLPVCYSFSRLKTR